MKGNENLKGLTNTPSIVKGGETQMRRLKKALIIGLTATALIASPMVPNFADAHKVEAASNYDYNDAKRVSTNTFTVKNNQFLVKVNNQFLMTSHKNFSNVQELNIANALYDSKRYLNVVYLPKSKSKVEALYFSVASNPIASQFGNTPISLSVYPNETKLMDGVKTKAMLMVAYDLYDSIDEKFYSAVYLKKIKNALMGLYGTKNGTVMNSYIMSIHRKYYNHVPRNAIRYNKTFGSQKVQVDVDPSGFYVKFS